MTSFVNPFCENCGESITQKDTYTKTIENTIQKTEDIPADISILKTYTCPNCGFDPIDTVDLNPK